MSSACSCTRGPSSWITRSVTSMGTLITTTSATSAACCGVKVVSRSAISTAWPRSPNICARHRPIPPLPPMIATLRGSMSNGTSALSEACRSRLAQSTRRKMLSTTCGERPNGRPRAHRSARICCSRTRSRTGTRCSRLNEAISLTIALRRESSCRISRSTASIMARKTGSGRLGGDSMLEC